jgi:hypothetical protein
MAGVWVHFWIVFHYCLPIFFVTGPFTSHPGPRVHCGQEPPFHQEVQLRRGRLSGRLLLGMDGDHGPNIYKDTNPPCRLYWCLIEFDIQSVMLVGIFDTSCELAPL